MRSNYRRIGDYIDLVDERNKDLSIDLLLGLSISKEFIPSVANIVGTNMANYKIIRKGQFACSIMQVRRDKKIPVALLEDHEIGIISQAYPVFRIKDETELLPQYLMMWFSRPEFDREACFYAVGGVRGSLEWEDFCNMKLPVPSIEKQREMVAEYNTVVNRIKLNEQLNQKLEETAQTIYRRWFVEFEFPISKEQAVEMGMPELEGKPYKSSGGKMVWNEELGKEVPQGWENIELDKIADISAGGDKPRSVTEIRTELYNIPIYANSTVNEGLYGYTDKAKVSEKSITISARGAIIGYTVLRLSPFFPIVRLIVVTPKREYLLSYLYECIRNFKFNNEASAQGQLTVPDISSFRIIKPNESILNAYQKYLDVIIEKVVWTKSQNHKLIELENLLLSKMTKVEPEKQLVE